MHVLATAGVSARSRLGLTVYGNTERYYAITRESRPAKSSILPPCLALGRTDLKSFLAIRAALD